MTDTTPSPDLLALAEAWVEAAVKAANDHPGLAIPRRMLAEYRPFAHALAAMAAAPARPGGDDPVKAIYDEADAACRAFDSWFETSNLENEDHAREAFLWGYSAGSSANPTPTREAAHDAERVERMRKAIARRIAKRIHGEQYEGYESTHAEDADDYARAALAAIAPEVRG